MNEVKNTSSGAASIRRSFQKLQRIGEEQFKPHMDEEDAVWFILNNMNQT